MILNRLEIVKITLVEIVMTKNKNDSSFVMYYYMWCTFHMFFNRVSALFLLISHNIKVMNVSLAEGDVVRFEDLGGRDPSVLANESILLKGLVVRSWSNQISIHFHFRSRQPQSSALLLRYQGEPSYASTSKHLLHLLPANCACANVSGWHGSSALDKPVYECTLTD